MIFVYRPMAFAIGLMGSSACCLGRWA